MLAQNVVNPDKKGKVEGYVFHLFYTDIHSSILFDKDMTTPIIWGSKTIVMTNLKKINELMPGNKPTTTKVRIYSYMISPEGYRRIDTYNGPVETIGKYIRRL